MSLRQHQARPMIAPPDSFDGSLALLFERYIEPNLPAEAEVEHWHERIVAHCMNPHSVFLVRTVKGLERRHGALTTQGHRLMPTDNSPGWWIHFVTFNAIRDAELADAPVHMHDVSRCLPTTISRAGWHVAHIFDAKDGNVDWRSWTRDELVRRFIRNLHPCNLFYIPKIDWSPYGRDPDVIRYFAATYAERYRSVWRDFLKLVGGQATSAGAIPAYRYPLNQRSIENYSRVLVSETPATYEYSRLCFKADIIEPLSLNDVFRIVTPKGTYRMTKGEFYQEFPNVVASNSYQQRRIYHYPITPLHAKRFLE